MASDSGFGAQQLPEISVNPWLLTEHAWETVNSLIEQRKIMRVDTRIPDDWLQTTIDTITILKENGVDVLEIDPRALCQAVIDQKETPHQF
jgi:hypothetical protein